MKAVAQGAIVPLLLAQMAQACPLDRAVYAEERSGAVLRFEAKTAEHGLMTTGVFALELPNMAGRFEGEITWSMGRNARPDGAIRRPCPDPENPEYEGQCWLWTGNIYAVGNETVGLVDDEAMAAPAALLLANFGRSLLWHEAFTVANPERYAMDLFTLTGCAP